MDAVHVAEFHGDGHPDDPGPIRLAELAAMFEECRRLSDDRLLLIPGEEANLYLGPRKPGRNPGHWLEMFPKPVYFTMKRAPGQPFVEDDPKYGTVYHVGETDDMFGLLDREHGLAWTPTPGSRRRTSHPTSTRTRTSSGADSWLGAAWKAMPADLSRPGWATGPRPARRHGQLGPQEDLIGEVDVFKLDHTHEVYGHMNVNYVKLDRLPRFDEGWQPILDALRAGRFFVTTGEVLLHSATIGGREGGQTLAPAPGRPPRGRRRPRLDLPAPVLEVVSGDGSKVYRERVDLSDTPPFGRKTLTLRPDLAGRTWARLEAWDIADRRGVHPAGLDRGRRARRSDEADGEARRWRTRIGCG